MAKKKNNYNMSVVDLSHYNIPHIKEDDRKDWVEFGLDNLYPQYLIELFTGSGINGAIVKGVSSMVAGDQQDTCQGLDVVDKDELEGDLREQYLKFSKLLKTGSRNTIKNLCFDLKLFGTCYINVIWNKTKTAIAEIKHIPSQYIRSGKADSYGKVNEFYYCYDWSNERKYKPHVIKAFNDKDRTETSQLLQIKEYNPQSFYYGIPDYVGGTDYIQLDMSIAELHLANIDNNFMPSCMVNFSNGIPTEEERREVERRLNAKFSGSGNSGKLIITFNDGKDTTPEIVPLNTGDNDDKYQFLSTEVSRKVLTAHRITSPLLFGVKSDSSGFGNNADELRDSYSLFNNTVVKVFQSTILEALDRLFRINGIDSLDIYFKTLKPADFLDLDSIDAIDEQEAGIDIEDETIEETQPISEDMPTEEVSEGEEIEVIQDSEASYNGAQISSAIDIVSKVAEGVLSKDQAIVFLIQFLQLPPEVAKRFFKDDENPKPMVDELMGVLKRMKKKKISTSVSQFKDVNKKKLKKDINTKPTKGMVEEAKKGLKWKKEHGRGGTEIGVARARDISNNKNLSISTIKRMNSFFARHESDKTGKGFEIGEEGFPSAGRIAWALWGGDAGQSWAKKKVKEIENKENSLSDQEFSNVFETLQGEVIDEKKWVVVDEKEEGDMEDIDLWVNRKIRKRKDFSDWVDSREGYNNIGDYSSYLDKSFYLIRFKYYKADYSPSASSRDFCDNMMVDARNGVVYRLEDIDSASRDGVNSKFGHGKGGGAYDLFKWKGGPFCKHAWKMVLYRLESETISIDEIGDTDIETLDAEYERVKTIPKSYIPSPWGWYKGTGGARTAPNKMGEGRGRYPGWQKRKDKI